MTLPENTLNWGRARNCIREISEYGAMRKKEIGADNVFDYSIGNPSVPSPACINETITELVRNTDPVVLHGYTTAAGLPETRQVIAAHLKNKFDVDTRPELIYITCGASAALAISFKALLLPGDEVLSPAPFFMEYTVFTESCGGRLIPVPPRSDMMIDLDALKARITEKTKAVVINSPNNPSGAVFDEENLKGLAAILEAAEEKYGHEIYLISDEPYRELVYDGEKFNSALKYYDNSIMCYSFAKGASLPGERIGYIALCSRMNEASSVYESVLGGGRALGYINPPSLFQRVIAECIEAVTDINIYRENRDILCDGLEKLGYTFVKPKGAFYLFVKSPIDDAKEFAKTAQKYELLVVPSDDFGVTGYVRVAYCVKKEMILKSLPAFEKLIKEYK